MSREPRVLALSRAAEAPQGPGLAELLLVFSLIYRRLSPLSLPGCWCLSGNLVHKQARSAAWSCSTLKQDRESPVMC